MVVAAGVAPDERIPGRFAVYCLSCREQPGRVPDYKPLMSLAELDAAAFVSIYEQALVQTDPAIASEIAWGVVDDAAVSKAAQFNPSAPS